MTFPLPLAEIFLPIGVYIVYLLIGFAFGYVLEISGFGNSKKLAAQFYFKDLTVLKVMFSAIVVAMVLIFLMSAFGILDYNMVWVNPTYLWPGIVGGLVMGIGFIVGGFCPGTSLAGAATGKLDAIFFAGGVLFGIFLFGETVGLYDEFFHSSYMGRLTLQDFFGIDTGLMVLLLVLMALFMFWGSEQLEKIFGKLDPAKAPKWRYGAAFVLVLVAVVGMVIGQPTHEDRWESIAIESEQKLRNREVQIHPGEMLDTMYDNKLSLVLLDVRSESDYNTFHIEGAKHVEPDKIADEVPELLLEEYNTVIVVISNNELAATEAWKYLSAEAVPNVYILEGGINYWLATFTAETHHGVELVLHTEDDNLNYYFNAAVGSMHDAASPDPSYYEFEYLKKIKLEIKAGPVSGGCG